MKNFLSPSEKSRLVFLHKQSRKRRFADKIKSILLLDEGFSFEQVAKILLLDDDTIRRYFQVYKTDGSDSLITDNNKGSSPKLSISQVASLESHLSDNVYPNSKGIINWIASQFNINYSSSGITALLKRLAYVYKKPKLTPGKVNQEKQEQFVEKYKQLKETLQSDDAIYFMDGVHPQHNSVASYGWIKKGKISQLKTNNGRKRTHINGALNLVNLSVVKVEDERINSQTVIVSLDKIQEEQAKGKIYVILDNARYYHAKIVKAYLAENPRVEFVFLPPYSPNLNIIERLWLILKRNVVYNTYYEKFDTFKKAVSDFFEKEKWKEEAYKNMLTDNFQLIKPEFSECYLR